MKQKSLNLAVALAAISAVSISPASAGSDPTGVWMNDTGRGAVEIKPCGNALCGYVVAVTDTSDSKGCGKQIIGDAQSVGSGRWDNGWIYSPERRKNYDVELKPLDDGTLRVVGYAGTKLFSRTMIWTRAPADLKRCGTIEANAAPAASANSNAALPKELSPSPTTAAPTSASPAPAVAPNAVANAPANSSSDAAKSADAKSASTPNASVANAPPVAENKPADTAAKDDETGGEKPGERKKGGIKLGDLDLDKFLTRTKSGKCKLDLPWVKVQFDCERD